MEQEGIERSPEFAEPGDSCPLPTHGDDDDDDDDDQPGAKKPFYLRLMPLGASITAGVGTSPQNGYRKPLRDQLRWKGWPVNMIGSQSNGDPDKFQDRQHEGHPGWVVANMTKAAAMSIDQMPNLILINCGTNDANPDRRQDVATTADRMEDLLDYLYDQVDGVTIILSTLLPYLEDTPNKNVNIINSGYRDLYQRLRKAGKKIGMAELNNGLLDTSSDYFDHIHPNEKGAAKLAAVWAKAIAEVEKAGFLTKPIDTGVSDNSTTECDVEKGQVRGPVRTQQGFGEDDGVYDHDQNVWDVPLAPNGFFDVGTTVSFAQLVNLGGADPGGEFDELIYCYDKGTADDPEFGNCVMILNDKGDLSGKEMYFDVGLKCLTRGQRWGDVNGDGLDDFICIGPDGNMYVSINRGGNPPTFEALENGGLIKKGYSWASQDRIRLGDIDGDGRLDYCAIDDKGDIYCWRNGGVGDAPTAAHNGYWQSFVCEPNSGNLIQIVLTCLPRLLASQPFMPSMKPRASVVSTLSTSTATADQTGYTCIRTRRLQSTPTSEETMTAMGRVCDRTGQKPVSAISPSPYSASKNMIERNLSLAESWVLGALISSGTAYSRGKIRAICQESLLCFMRTWAKAGLS